MATTILLLIFAMGAAFVQRTTGFGFGIFIMTILPYLLPSYGEATALSGLLAMVTSSIIVIKTWRHIVWRELLPIFCVFLLFSIMAIELLSILRSDTLHIMLGLTLIIISIKHLFFSNPTNESNNQESNKTWWQRIAQCLGLGSLSGVMGGLFGMQGPPAVMYFLSVSKTKEKYIAMAQTYFLLGNLLMTIYRSRVGFISQQVITCWAMAIPAVLLGTWLGMKVYNSMPLPIIRKIVYIYIAFSGLLALLQ